MNFRKKIILLEIRGIFDGKSIKAILELWLLYSKLILFKEGLLIFTYIDLQEFRVFVCFFLV